MDAEFFASLLPAGAGVRIEQIHVESAQVFVDLMTTAAVATCPQCGHATSAVHGRYVRTLHDQPCLGHPLTLRISARKFRCPTAECSQRIFCERLPGLTTPQARDTGLLRDAHRSIGLALGGEAGARLAVRLALPISADTLLRRVKAMPAADAPPPRFVGLDDWATRKGHSYGTILIDLERGTVIDLLPGRDGESLKRWLAANPQVEVITRDRWPSYMDAATQAAPQAKQVADRFHLLRNVREAVEQMLARHGEAIRNASREVDTATHSRTPVEADASQRPPSPADAGREAKRQQRRERFQRVKDLTIQGYSSRAIARLLGMSIRAVLKYRRRDRVPDWHKGRVGPTQMQPYAAFIETWRAAGNRNSAELFRLLRQQGYTGGYDSVRRYLNRLIGSAGRPGRRDPSSRPKAVAAPSARKLSFRVVNPRPESRSSQVLRHLREQPAVATALGLAEEMIAMLRQQRPADLRGWAARVQAHGPRELQTFAQSLLRDGAAVEAAMTTSWSNGPVEGHVNRLKTIKRQMYGRAGLPLLKARVLNAA